jgi:DnaK suppressor protein
MTEEKAQQLKERIEKVIKRTQSDIEDLIELTQPIELSSAVGRLSRMDAINNKSVNEAALRESKDKLKRMEHSLTKFGTEDFGRCVNCKNEIQYERLFFLPDSVKCMKCAR